MAYGDIPRDIADLEVASFGDERPPTELEVFEKNVRAVFEDMTELLISKRRSYGPSNLLEDGGYGILIRASDKVGRLRTMYKSGSYVNDDGDSLFDAWRDLIGYAVLAILYETEEHFKREREKRDNPPPGVRYVDIQKPPLPTARTITIGGFDGPTDFIATEAEGVSYLIGNPKNHDTQPHEVLNMTGWEGEVVWHFDVGAVEVNGVWMTNDQFTAVLKGMQFNPFAQDAKNTDDTELPNHRTARDMFGASHRKVMADPLVDHFAENPDIFPPDFQPDMFTYYECAKCGTKAYQMSEMPYDCHPFTYKLEATVADG